MGKRKTVNIDEIVRFTGMIRHTIYNKMTAGNLPFKWFMENGRRVSYFDEMAAWFYSEAEKDFSILHPFVLLKKMPFYDEEQARKIGEIIDAHIEKNKNWLLQKEEQERIKHEEYNKKKREYMRLKRLASKR